MDVKVLNIDILNIKYLLIIPCTLRDRQSWNDNVLNLENLKFIFFVLY